MKKGKFYIHSGMDFGRILMQKEEHELALFRKARTHNSKPLRNKEHHFLLFRTFGTYNNTLIALQTCMLVREKTPIVKHVNIVLSYSFL